MERRRMRAGCRRAVLAVVGLLVLGVACRGAAGGRAGGDRSGGERPNVLLITVDDLDWASLGVTGNPIPGISPNVDRLASEGLRFAHAHVTVAICHPSRNVWMTGRYPQNAGALGFEDIDAGVPTLVEALAQSGYYTGLMAKTGHVVPSRAAAWNEQVLARELKNGRSPPLYYERALAFFARARQAGKPFFLMANAQDPHRPFAGSDQEAAFRARDSGSTDTHYGGGFPDAAVGYAPAAVPVPGFLPDLPAVRRELAEYYTSVRRADETTGALLRALDESGLADRTVVMWLSDNGMALPFGKANVWLQSTHTPWIVRWPGTVSRGRVDPRHFVSGIDLAPTILDIAGLPNLDGAEGRSFLPLLRGAAQAGRERVFTQIDNVSSGASYPMRSVIDAQYGYIFNAWADDRTEFRIESMTGRTFAAMRRAAETDTAIAARVRFFVYRGKEELYDYRRDPNALRNLIGTPGSDAIAARYRELLLRHLRESADPQLPAFERFLAERRRGPG
jgi:N-sulfoglucosamine sulfohydrolase